MRDGYEIYAFKTKVIYVGAVVFWGGFAAAWGVALLVTYLHWLFS